MFRLLLFCTADKQNAYPVREEAGFRLGHGVRRTLRGLNMHVPATEVTTPAATARPTSTRGDLILSMLSKAHHTVSFHCCIGFPFVPFLSSAHMLVPASLSSLTL